MPSYFNSKFREKITYNIFDYRSDIFIREMFYKINIKDGIFLPMRQKMAKNAERIQDIQNTRVFRQTKILYT